MNRIGALGLLVAAMGALPPTAIPRRPPEPTPPPDPDDPIRVGAVFPVVYVDADRVHHKGEGTVSDLDAEGGVTLSLDPEELRSLIRAAIETRVVGFSASGVVIEEVRRGPRVVHELGNTVQPQLGGDVSNLREAEDLRPVTNIRGMFTRPGNAIGKSDAGLRELLSNPTLWGPEVPTTGEVGRLSSQPLFMEPWTPNRGAARRVATYSPPGPPADVKARRKRERKARKAGRKARQR